MFKKFRGDIDRYVVLRQKFWLIMILTEQGLWALAEHRFSNWVHYSIQIPLLRHFLKLVSIIWHKAIEICTGISICCEAKIGKGLYIGHFGGIFINGGVVIGENCNISQGVTIGLGGRDSRRGCPKIGDRVFIGPGAKVFGSIIIENDAAIGANAVVTKSLPNKAVAVGIPAQVISYKGSKEYIVYRI
ncbi:serine O-acetyltransferase [Leptolyngbya sp. CCNP1308]|uniref:serine O-acetyltransferase n=1 Tax=Leptolyngbya sp. CCNP1308 TaxID=3110255 RepID=UPI002B21B12F|nr:serine O-acetyltransferase [Leptolyngbya sp. CCNP1308]MEA5449347.1 serine O-acetyltransferase [Leptolyngbya sp. CCNP1308]